MGMQENWELFVESAKSKADSHLKSAQYWDKVHNSIGVGLIVLSALTTVLALLTKEIPFYVTAIVSALTTLLSALGGFLQPSERRQRQVRESYDGTLLAGAKQAILGTLGQRGFWDTWIFIKQFFH